MCTADQATFTNITDVQVAADTNATVIKEVAVWMDPAFSDGLFDSCKVGSRIQFARLFYFILVSSAYVFWSLLLTCFFLSFVFCMTFCMQGVLPVESINCLGRTFGLQAVQYNGWTPAFEIERSPVAISSN